VLLVALVWLSSPARHGEGSVGGGAQ